MSKFVEKHRHNRDYENDYYDDYNTKNSGKSKKHRNATAEMRKMRNRQYQEDDYGYEGYHNSRRYAKL